MTIPYYIRPWHIYDIIFTYIRLGHVCCIWQIFTYIWLHLVWVKMIVVLNSTDVRLLMRFQQTRGVIILPLPNQMTLLLFRKTSRHTNVGQESKINVLQIQTTGVPVDSLTSGEIPTDLAYVPCSLRSFRSGI